MLVRRWDNPPDRGFTNPLPAWGPQISYFGFFSDLLLTRSGNQANNEELYFLALNPATMVSGSKSKSKGNSKSRALLSYNQSAMVLFTNYGIMVSGVQKLSGPERNGFLHLKQTKL